MSENIIDSSSTHYDNKQTFCSKLHSRESSHSLRIGLFISKECNTSKSSNKSKLKTRIKATKSSDQPISVVSIVESNVITGIITWLTAKCNTLYYVINTI